MRPWGSKPGVLYGLCKVHKKPDELNRLPPLRQIILAIGAFSYSLAKFFVPILKEFTINEYTVKDSFSFQMKFVTKALAYIWLRLTSSLYSHMYHWIRQLTFVWNCYLITEKLKECLKNMQKNSSRMQPFPQHDGYYK